MRLALLLLISFSVHAHERIVPVCERTPVVRKAIEDSLAQKCDKIVRTDLRRIGILWVQGSRSEPATSLKSGDFSGLIKLKDLNISRFGNGLRINEDVIASLPALRTLSLFSMGHLEIKEGALTDLPELLIVSLVAAYVPVLPKIFGYCPSLDFVEIRRTKTEEIADGIFADLGNISEVLIEDLPLSRTSKGAFRGVSIINGLPKDFFRLADEEPGL